MEMIKVLWIDDMPNEAFMDKAYNKCIDITNAENVDAGIEAILAHESSFDAIILDANCVYHKEDAPEITKVSALQYALRKISENNIHLPWFVYSGGGFEGEAAISVLVQGYERPYDDVDWYKKPSQMNELFAKILNVVPQSSEYKIKKKYANLFAWYPNPKELLDIIDYVESNKINDASVFNKIRKELDWVMEYLYDCGLLQEPYKGSNLAECSTFLGDKNLLDFVPLHVQRSFHSTTSICNEGSHRLKMDELVKNWNAPYLIQSTVMEFLNILFWVKDMPKTPEGREDFKISVKEKLSNATPKFGDYEGKDYVIEQDERGNYHCGQCLLSYKIDNNLLGQVVTLSNVVENSTKSKDIYPCFARKFRITEV